MNFRICLFLAISVYCVAARLTVFSPAELKLKFDDSKGVIPASYANYGIVPYGKIMAGRIYFFESNPDGCDPFKDPLDTSGDPDSDISPIIIVKRGKCSFVQKTRNVQNLGGSLAIIVDNTDEDVTHVIMTDDGTGSGIVIPSTLINRAYGDILIDFLVKSDKTLARKAAIVAEFKMYNPDNRVEYDIWFTSSDTRSLKVIKDLRHNNDLLERNVLMTPHYVVWKCVACEKSALDKDCFSNGKYCALVHSGQKVTGREVLVEDLRQKCLYNQTIDREYAKPWWDYIDQVDTLCKDGITEECSNRALQKIGYDSGKIKKCVTDSFSSSTWDNAENPALEAEVIYWIRYGSHYFPAIVINNRTYRGELDATNILYSLCAGFQTPPEICYPAGSGRNPVVVSSEGIGAGSLIMIVILLLAFFVVVIFCYRRYLKRELRDEMQFQINTAVSQYFALSEARDTRDNKPLVKSEPRNYA